MPPSPSEEDFIASLRAKAKADEENPANFEVHGYEPTAQEKRAAMEKGAEAKRNIIKGRAR